MRNKKGEISITILVLGVFLVCSFALLTFFISDFKTSNSFVGVEKVREMSILIDQYKFYKNQEVDPLIIESSFDIQVDSQGVKKFYLEQKDSSFGFEGDKILFSVEYPFS